MLDIEGEGTVIPGNSGNYLPLDTAHLPRIFEVSANKLHTDAAVCAWWAPYQLFDVYETVQGVAL